MALDKKGKKLGKISRVEFERKVKDSHEEPYAIIEVRKIIKKDSFVPIKITRLLRADEEDVWFNITKKEFNEKRKILEIQKRQAFTDGKEPPRHLFLSVMSTDHIPRQKEEQ